MSADQPVEHAATLDDVRAEVLSSDRLNVVVFGVFAGVALLIAVVGVAACWHSRSADARGSLASGWRLDRSRGVC
jgi:hypothetical protein